jgi:hypothetical protein
LDLEFLFFIVARSGSLFRGLHTEQTHNTEKPGRQTVQK